MTNMDNAKSSVLKVKSKPKILDFFGIAFAEFIGTGILVFLSCMASTGVQGGVTSLHLSLNAGLGVMAIVQIFGHISGAHINPVVTLSALILNEVTLLQTPIYIISQILGALAGCAFQLVVTPDIYENFGHGVCVTAPHQDITDWQALGVEIILTTILIFAVCSSWDNRNSDKKDSVPLKIGLVVGSLNLAGSAYTGASMNPARSLGPSVWTGDYAAHWVYWVGPTIGSLLATYFYKYLYLRDGKKTFDNI